MRIKEKFKKKQLNVKCTKKIKGGTAEPGGGFNSSRRNMAPYQPVSN